MESIELLEKLSNSTGECDRGPIIESHPGKVVVRYDVEGELGPVWTDISFDSALALKTTPDISVNEEQVKAYSAICEVNESSWLRTLALCGERFEHKLAGLRHFILYFDHVCAVEVVAKSYRIDH